MGPREAAADRRIAEVARRQHGVVARAQLQALGLSASAIESRLRRGSLLTVRHGVYAVGHLALAKEGGWLAAVLTLGPAAVLSHRTAALAWRLIPAWSGPIEATRPTNAKARAGMRIHRAALPNDEIAEVDRIPVTSVFRTIFDLAAVSSRRELERAFHEAEVRELRDRLSLWGLLERYPCHGRG